MTSHPNLINLRLNREQTNVIIGARGSLRIASLANSRDFLTFEVTLEIFLQIGKNDVLSFNVDTIVREIVAVVSYICSGVGIRTVIIGHYFVVNLGLHRRICGH